MAAVVGGRDGEQRSEEPVGGQPLIGDVGGPLKSQRARTQPVPCRHLGLVDLCGELADIGEYGAQRVAD